MAVIVTLNSVPYRIPTQGDLDWGDLTNYLVALPSVIPASITIGSPANGLVLTGNQLTLTAADASHSGALTNADQTIGGVKTFVGTISAANLSGTNTGNVSLNPVGATPSGSGATLSNQTLTLQPADGSNPGLVSIVSQSFQGSKTFLSDLTFSTGSVTSSVANSGAAIAFKLNAGNNLFTSGAKLLSLQNNAVEKLFVDKDGNLTANNFSGTTSGTNTGDVTLAAFGSSANANGASLAGQVLTLQPASGSQPGGVSTTTQTFAGAKTMANDFTLTTGVINSSVANSGTAKAIVLNSPSYATAGAKLLSVQNNTAEKFSVDKDGVGAFSSTLTASNLSGTNTGDITLAAFGSAPSTNGASLSGQVLTLQPADATHPGGVSTGLQTFAGDKTFSGNVSIGNGVALTSTNINNLVSSTADSTNNIAFVFQTGALTASGTKVASFQNNGNEKLGLDKNGNGTFAGSSVTAAAGNSTGAVSLQGTVNVQTGAAVGNTADTNEDTLFTYTLPANAFSASGKGVRVTAWGSGVNTANATTVRAYFGSTVVINQVLTVSQANFWKLVYEVFQTSTANTQTASGIIHVGTGSATAATFNSVTTPNQTTASTIVIKVTGQRGTTGTANSVVCNGFFVEFIN